MEDKEKLLSTARELSVKISDKILAHLGEYSEFRESMVELIINRGVVDKRVLFAMRVLPRHLFVPENLKHYSYEDSPLEIGLGQTISQPYITALMTEQLELTPNDKVLEVGTGSGYHTGILKMLSGRVITVEYEKELSERAQKVLEYLELSDDVVFVVGDGSLGFEKEAPYDKICVSSATSEVPPPLLEQLKENGILIIPLGSVDEQFLCKIIKRADGKGITRKEICGCRFVRMKGKYGLW